MSNQHTFTSDELSTLRNYWRRLGESVLRKKYHITAALCAKEVVMCYGMMRELQVTLVLNSIQPPEFLNELLSNAFEDFKKDKKQKREDRLKKEVDAIITKETAEVFGKMTPAKLIRKICLSHGEIGEAIYKEYLLGLAKLGRK